MQAIRQNHNKAVEILKKVFTGGNVEPSLNIKMSTKDVVYVAFYVGDNLMIKNPDTIDEAVEQLKRNGLVLEALESLQNYLLFGM